MTNEAEAEPRAKTRMRREIVDAMRGLHKVVAVSSDALPKVEAMTPAEIAALRERTGVSQAVLAGFMNVAVNTVSQWERGERQPTGAALKLLHVVRQNGLDALRRGADATGADSRDPIASGGCGGESFAAAPLAGTRGPSSTPAIVTAMAIAAAVVPAVRPAIAVVAGVVISVVIVGRLIAAVVWLIAAVGRMIAAVGRPITSSIASSSKASSVATMGESRVDGRA